MRVIAIDPGKHKSGFAVFVDGELVGSGLAETTDGLPEWARGSVDVAVIEAPRIYDRRRWKGDPNHLIDVAIAGGFVLGGVTAGELKVIRPEDWKGQTPKEIQAARTLRTLSSKERKRVSSDHNEIDAVGIGLWEVKR